MTAPYKEGDFERAIEAHLLAHGWQAGDPSAYDKDLGLDVGELLAFIASTQPKQWEKLATTRYGGDETKAQATFLKTVAKMLDKQGVLRCVRTGVSVMGIEFELAYFRPEHGLTQELTQRYEANRVTVVRQLAYSKANNNTLDIVLLLNGIPVATTELKSLLTNQTVEHAKKQYRTDRDPKELIFAKRALVHFAVDTDEVFLTTRLAWAETRFLPFNRGHNRGAGNPPAEPGKYSTSYLWEDVWQRDNWLDLVRRFIHLQKDDDETKVIFPRYHQLDAVRQLVAHARSHGVGHNYLIEHSAGSGKSNTIAWLAHRLAVLHGDDDTRVFDKVIVVTDRLVLDRQLGDTIYQFEHVPGLVEKTRSGSGQLAKALSSKSSRVVISTLQKFPFVLDKITELAEGRFAVVIDEAHSSQGGEAAKALRQALGAAARELDDEQPNDAGGGEVVDADEVEVQDLLAASVKARGRQPNLSYFAFTATPTRRTLGLFGQLVHGRHEPFHLYSMKQAIEEGFILDVLKHYTPYSVLWKVASKADEDKEVEKSKATQAIVRFVSRHPKTLSEKANIVAEHCHNVVAHRIGGKAKAMYVCASRELAVRTYFAIKKAVQELGYDDCKPLVAFSETVVVDGEPHTEAGINGFGDAELPKQFGSDEYRILVVAEKYQTGFDQPLLHTMYVDKKLRGVRAVQTLSRLNRIHPEKGDSFVLDFVNDVDSIQKAFEDYYETTIAEATDPAELYVAHGNLMAFGVIAESDEAAFAEVFLGEAAQAAQAGSPKATGHAELLNHLQPAVARFEELDEDDRKSFRLALGKFLDIYAFLAQAVAFTDVKLEATYLYGRHLQRALPSEHGGSLDLGGDIVLTHLRVEAGHERDVSPGQGGDTIGPESGEAPEPTDPETASLQNIIEDLNARFGSELNGKDRVLIEKVLDDMAEDDALRQKAKVNSRENFMLDFARLFEDEVMGTENTSRMFFERFFSDDDFRAALIASAGGEFHRRHSGETDTVSAA